MTRAKSLIVMVQSEHSKNRTFFEIAPLLVKADPTIDSDLVSELVQFPAPLFSPNYGIRQEVPIAPYN